MSFFVYLRCHRWWHMIELYAERCVNTDKSWNFIPSLLVSGTYFSKLCRTCSREWIDCNSFILKQPKGMCNLENVKLEKVIEVFCRWNHFCSYVKARISICVCMMFMILNQSKWNLWIKRAYYIVSILLFWSNSTRTNMEIGTIALIGKRQLVYPIPMSRKENNTNVCLLKRKKGLNGQKITHTLTHKYEK